MKIILAETGQDVEISGSHLELSHIKLEIEKRFHIKSADQILISANGTLLKESDKDPIIVAFNRRLLQDHATVQRLMNSIPEVTESLIDSKAIPNLKELETMIYLYEVEERDDELYDTLDRIIQICIQTSKQRKALIDGFVREFSGQAIALNAALNNLESHVRIAHQTVGKFDRIAQREFSKHAIAIASIDLDINLLQNIQLHPRVCHISNSVQLDRHTTLGTFVPLKELEKSKQAILHKYDELVSATLEQKNKVTYLHQQTANVSTQRTTSDIVMERVQKIKNEVDRFTGSVLDISQKIYDELKRRKRQKKKQTLHLDLPQTTPPSPPFSSSVSEKGMDGSSTLTIRYPLSPPTTHQHNSRKKKTQYILRDAVRSLYLHDTFIHGAEKSVIEEKQTSLKSFIHCMQSISQVEESVTKVYPRLADLEKEIKVLRQEIEKGKGATARRVIAGYGMLLIELWRRDKYTEIVKGNASLLQSLFGEFGQLEKTYRKSFESEIICLEKNQILSATSEQQAILPFQMQMIDDPPIICSTSTNSSSEDYDNVNVTRKEVEEYIQMVHSYYASSMPINNNEKKPKLNTKVEISRDVSHILAKNLEREAKRIRAGLAQLGLPGARQDVNLSVMIDRKDSGMIPTSPSSSSTTTSSNISSAFPSTYFTPDMKLASSPASQFTEHHLSSMSPTTVLYQQQQKDWELERASILRQSQEYRKYIEDLRMKHEQDKAKFEKDKQSLLRKLYTQETRIEEIKENFNNQIQDCKVQLENAEKDHKIKENEWKQKYETTLQTEQEKYDRRLNGFHQRMNAKDEEYAKLEETYLRETKSAPSSPTSSTFISVHRSRLTQPSPPVNIITQEQYDRDINDLKQKITQLVSSHQAEILKLQQEKQTEFEELQTKLQEEHREQLKQVSDALRSEHKGNNEKFLALIDSLESEKKTYVEKLTHFDALKEQMDLDRTREFNMLQGIIDDLKNNLKELKEKHQSKILQMNEKFNSSEARLKSLFINENQQITMQCEARIANLVAEHQNNMQELKDTYDNEKEVIQIKHQTAFDEKCRSFETDKKESEKVVNDLTLVINQTKEQKEKLRVELVKYKKDSAAKTKELMSLQQEQRAAKRIARDVLSLSSDSHQPEKVDPNARLLDMLSKALSNITTLKTCNNIMEQSMDSPSYMMNMSSYGF